MEESLPSWEGKGGVEAWGPEWQLFLGRRGCLHFLCFHSVNVGRGMGPQLCSLDRHLLFQICLIAIEDSIFFTFSSGEGGSSLAWGLRRGLTIVVAAARLARNGEPANHLFDLKKELGLRLQLGYSPVVIR